MYSVKLMKSVKEYQFRVLNEDCFIYGENGKQSIDYSKAKVITVPKGTIALLNSGCEMIGRLQEDGTTKWIESENISLNHKYCGTTMHKSRLNTEVWKEQEVLIEGEGVIDRAILSELYDKYIA